jgi:hypothetical protein
MTTIAEAYLDAQAYRWLRPNWRLSVQRGSALEKFYEEIERKYHTRPGARAGRQSRRRAVDGRGRGRKRFKLASRADRRQRPQRSPGCNAGHQAGRSASASDI